MIDTALDGDVFMFRQFANPYLSSTDQRPKRQK
jgi:hypothetical protein